MRPGLAGISILLCALQVSAQTEKLIEKRTKELIRQNGKGTDRALRQQLLAMGKLDQQVRKPLETMFTKNAKSDQVRVDAINRNMADTDRQLTQQLKDIVTRNGWPTIHLVGAEASSSAAIILVHSPDHEFQRGLLPQLDGLVSDGKIIGSDIAKLTDKLLIGDGKLQRFGTQFHVADGEAVPVPVEDPAHLDELRAKYMLPPMDEYKKLLAKMYHVTTK
jgi:hypothetical protein